jgi:hypothetical protein
MWHLTFTNVYIHYEKMGWFAINLATRFLSCNNHSQPIYNSFATQCISMSECYRINWISCNIECNLSHVKSCTYAILAIQLQLWRNNYHVTLTQLICNYHGNIMLTSHGIMGDFGCFFFKILISTIHYDCSFIMVLNCNMWDGQKLPCGILIEFWKLK